MVPSAFICIMVRFARFFRIIACCARRRRGTTVAALPPAAGWNALLLYGKREVFTRLFGCADYISEKHWMDTVSSPIPPLGTLIMYDQTPVPLDPECNRLMTTLNIFASRRCFMILWRSFHRD